jgi:ABC-type bacteriocin/lantibiotic exporter with double-glycine peptidase domain
MNTEEKRILKTLVEQGTPQSPSEFVNGISRRNERAIQVLMIGKYIETTPVKKFGEIYDFYRPTEKGIAKSKNQFKWFWYNFRSDIRNILVAFITALITTMLTLILN